ncbi:type 2 isopentenyl-diphosphate Delta-isomerase [Salirhabdus salicampi]|uniref:type 2 isopentenyl-diphosphate Delta-isomerase n=1 Tax=Salirhabdus salicampi TaxID=476102 RepID=UPI0020C34C59|nr:type 2 isopentenyl-diphosphate Delta-isomerase [Salirhabdus salicampi]MCP8616714.1 type 2 isopentenyl-diphosphate Delta-isomerase [Salirhabdus salicampi]
MDRIQRKVSHIEQAIAQQTDTFSSFDEMDIVHQSLSNINWKDITLNVKSGELSLSSPLFVNAMTGGGGQKTENINRSLAEVAKETGITMAVGSQMAALKDSEQTKSFQVVRQVNPDGVIFANIGSEATVDQAKRAIDMVEANALQIHLNVLQELIMPEGDRTFSGRLQNIEDIRKHVDVPVIVKEVGFGISKETARQLRDIGIDYIDVSGKGGTRFSEIENRRRQTPVEAFNQWGIPTIVAVKEVKAVYSDKFVYASGGVRHGLDGVKAIVAGADMFGMAGRLLKILFHEGAASLKQEIETIHEEVKIAMVTLGVSRVKDLQNVPHVFYGRTKEWLDQRR